MREILSKLYHKLYQITWLQPFLEYCKEHLALTAVLFGIAVFVFIVICVLVVRGCKAKKARKNAQPKAVEGPKPAPVAEKKVESPTPVVEKKVETPTPAAEKKLEAPTPVVEKKVKTPTPVAEKKAVQPVPAPAEKVAPAPVPKAEIKEEKKTEPVKEETKTPTPTPVKESEKTPVSEVAEEPIRETPPARTSKSTLSESALASLKAKVEKPSNKKEEAPPPAPVVEIVEEVEETPVETPVETESKTDLGEMIALVESIDVDDGDPFRDHYDEGEMDKIAKYKGKWSICRVLTDAKDSEEMYFFELHASNGERLLTSEEYTTYQGALRGIQTHKTNILNGNLKVTLSKKGDYIFKLLSGKNLLLCMGENYPSKARCESAIASTVRFAATAVLDENVQDIVVKVPKEDDSPIPPLPEGCNGKWIISSTEGANGEKLYYFELFANNGEKLLSSEEYTTYIGAVNGIQTHKKNIEKDNFRITLTKRGDYIYKLLNANEQLLCLGEHYKTKRLCQNAVESVKRFAMNSPVLTLESNK